MCGRQLQILFLLPAQLNPIWESLHHPMTLGSPESVSMDSVFGVKEVGSGQRTRTQHAHTLLLSSEQTAPHTANHFAHSCASCFLCYPAPEHVLRLRRDAVCVKRGQFSCQLSPLLARFKLPARSPGPPPPDLTLQLDLNT
mgnify:CR=1 FL=1